MSGDRKFGMDYIDVATRIVDFRNQYPDGSLQPADPAIPYRVETIADQTFIVVVAAAYRTPGDERPGIGMAYEPFPGRTQFTRGSELQNAETSAWGRAIVAALAGDTKRGIASAEEVRNRQSEQQVPPSPRRPSEPEGRGHTAPDGWADDARREKLLTDLGALCDERGLDKGSVAAEWAAGQGQPITQATDLKQLAQFIEDIRRRAAMDASKAGARS